MSQTSVIDSNQLLEQWQGHRRLTRRVIEAFPEDKLFSYSLGGMRPFSEMAMEFIKMAEPIAHGVATGEWKEFGKQTAPASKAELLKLWDESVAAVARIWPTIPEERFAVTDVAFGQWENANYATVLYAIDNEVHHRGQAYVYLRSLGIEPPHFWER